MPQHFIVKKRFADELTEIATKSLNEWRVQDSYPIEIEQLLEKHYGIKCLPSYQLEKLLPCEAGGAVSRDQKTIYLDGRDWDEERYQFRLRMTVAHEFAHIKLHQAILSRISSEQDIRYLLKFFSRYPGKESEYETQAFSLAACIMMPEQTIEKVTLEVCENLKKKIPEGQEGRHYSASAIFWRKVSERVARKYEVTPQAMRKRLKWLELWGKEV